jgi:hypothetical protein
MRTNSSFGSLGSNASTSSSSSSAKSLSEMELKRASQVRAKSVTYRDTRVLAGLHGYAFSQVSSCFEALTSTFRNAPSALSAVAALIKQAHV